jgi:hypothetical protein
VAEPVRVLTAPASGDRPDILQQHADGQVVEAVVVEVGL